MGNAAGVPSGYYADKDGQPFKYNEKELDRMHGMTLYDYSARTMDPTFPRFLTVDPLCEKYYGISLYAYCGNNFVNAIDPDGRLVIFINGIHNGTGGKSIYWAGIDKKIMDRIKDWNPDYIDGSHGGTKSLPYNLSVQDRSEIGYRRGKDYAKFFIYVYQSNDGSFKETIKIITHSMGAAYVKGFIKGLLEAGIPLSAIEFEADFAPFQPTKQKAVNGVRTFQFSHKQDDVANSSVLGSPQGKIEGVSSLDYFNDDDKTKVHQIDTFWDEINRLPEGKYIIVNGQIESK